MFKSRRPSPARRCFTSPAVEKCIKEVSAGIGDPELAWLFSNCYPNTLDTTVDFGIVDGMPDTFIITGDIDAMWLRDSSAQVQAYLPLCREDAALARMIEGLIRRQTRCILLDPYANAFYKDPEKISPWQADNTRMLPGVHERKWELDSLTYCIRLAWQYWKITGDASPFDPEWKKAMRTIIDVMRDQQRKTGNGAYYFRRTTDRPIDTAAGHGYGNPVKPTGMVCSTFRNSDDAALYLFNIPENLFAVTSLRQLAEIWESFGQKHKADARVCHQLAKEIEKAVHAHGIVLHPRWGAIYAYECDGFGNTYCMDDAGIPSLLAIPYLGYKDIHDPVYCNTRRFSMSRDNPYYYRTSIAEGIGSPHTANHGECIWPMSIIARGLTSDSKKEIDACLAMLKRTHAGTGLMHESFQADDPSKFTRKWFSWPNNLFGELILKRYN